MALTRARTAVRRSPLLDARWYASRYLNSRSAAKGLVHYRRHGIHEHRQPNEFFDPAWYLRRYPEAGSRCGNPVDDYLVNGVALGLDPGPRFSTTDYLERYPDVAASGLNPLVHYLRFGRAEGRVAAPSTIAHVSTLGAGIRDLRRWPSPLPRSTRVSYVIPASPTDGFYSQVAMIRLALDDLGEPYRSARIVMTVGAPEGSAVPDRWIPFLERVEVRFVRQTDDGRHRAQADGRWDGVPESDIVVFADADTLPLRRFDELLGRVLELDAVAGAIAHTPLRFDTDLNPDRSWSTVGTRLTGREPEVAFATTMPFGSAGLMSTPFYVNFGMVPMSMAVFQQLRPAYARLTQAVESDLIDRRFAGQAGLALAVNETGVNHFAIDMRYNFPNDERAEQRYPDDAVDIRTFHYMRTQTIDRQRIFTGPEEFQHFLVQQLRGSNAIFQERVRQLTGGRYPF